jgi:hypothetical protein
LGTTRQGIQVQSARLMWWGERPREPKQIKLSCWANLKYQCAIGILPADEKNL